MGGSAEVVSIGTAPPSRLLPSCLRPGRRGTPHARPETARTSPGYIDEQTGWDVMPETITAWEDDETSARRRGARLLTATQGLPVLAASLLAACRPPSPLSAGRAVGHQLPVQPRGQAALPR